MRSPARNPAERALVYRVFSQALDLTGDARERFLDENCSVNPALRGEVEAMLEIARVDGVETGALIDAAAAAAATEESLAGRSVGRFRLLKRIGTGGMGVVYLAERTDGVQQAVAVKLVSSVLDAAIKPRFEREAQILARLEHPSIARLIDAGVEDGRAWIAIEHVRGERIDHYCAERKLAAADIVRLLIQLAGAVSVAHGMLVVHSDIKPGNVLVTAEGQPKLIDFGISTVLRDVSAHQEPTVTIGRLFSPNYAALEQVSGGAVTVATDVFGLGALAYRLLAGAPPYRDATRPVDYLLAVSQRDPEPPSRTALAVGRTASATQALRGDLDAILCKALERNPGRRYASAADFRSDLQRYLDGRPVLARAPSWGYRLGKFTRRNALAVGLSILLTASVVAGASATWLQGRNTAVVRDMAARRGDFLESVLKSANPREGRRNITVAELLDASARTLDEKFGAEPLVEASLLGLIGDTNTELGRYPEALIARDRELALMRGHGASDVDVALAESARGDLLSRTGAYREAEAALRDAIAVLRRNPGEAAALVDALDTLGGVLATTNRSREAEQTLTEAIALDAGRTGEPRHRLARLQGVDPHTGTAPSLNPTSSVE
jgi:serine/threonine-protein kinase